MTKEIKANQKLGNVDVSRGNELPGGMVSLEVCKIGTGPVWKHVSMSIRCHNGELLSAYEGLVQDGFQLTKAAQYELAATTLRTYDMGKLPLVTVDYEGKSTMSADQLWVVPMIPGEEVAIDQIVAFKFGNDLYDPCYITLRDGSVKQVNADDVCVVDPETFLESVGDENNSNGLYLCLYLLSHPSEAEHYKKGN